MLYGVSGFMPRNLARPGYFDAEAGRNDLFKLIHGIPYRSHQAFARRLAEKPGNSEKFVASCDLHVKIIDEIEGKGFARERFLGQSSLQSFDELVQAPYAGLQITF